MQDVFDDGAMLSLMSMESNTGADPGFLERGFVCIKVWGFACLSLSLSFFFVNIPLK